MITHLISSHTIISKVISDLDIREDQLRISDMLEWVGEAVGKIGGISEMNYTEEFLPLHHGKAKLPCDLNKLVQVAYVPSNASGLFPMRYTTSSFRSESCGNCGGCNKDRYVSDDFVIDVYRQMNRKPPVSYKEAADIIYNNREMRTALKELISNKLSTTSGEYRNGFGSGDIQYFAQRGYITCNRNCGFVKIAYNAVPRDDKGYVLVPNNESYIEAVYWYIVMKLQYPQYVKGDIPQYVYHDTKNTWNYYCKQAYGDIKMPNLDQFESIKNAWLQLYPVMDEHDTFYSHLGQRQRIYNKNN